MANRTTPAARIETAETLHGTAAIHPERFEMTGATVRVYRSTWHLATTTTGEAIAVCHQGRNCYRYVSLAA